MRVRWREKRGWNRGERGHGEEESFKKSGTGTEGWEGPECGTREGRGEKSWKM